MEQCHNDADPSTRIETARQYLTGLVKAVFRHPDSFPLQAFRGAQRVRWGDLDYQEVWSTLFRAGLESGAPESWVRAELYNGFANANAFKIEPPELTALEGGTA